MIDSKIISVIIIILLILSGLVYVFYTHVYKDLVLLRDKYEQLNNKVNTIASVQNEKHNANCITNDLFKSFIGKDFCDEDKIVNCEASEASEASEAGNEDNETSEAGNEDNETSEAGNEASDADANDNEDSKFKIF